MLLNDDQINEMKRLREALIASNSLNEIKYLSSKIHQILDEAESNDYDNFSSNIGLSNEGLHKLREYQNFLLKATTMNEIQYFDEKILELFESGNLN